MKHVIFRHFKCSNGTHGSVRIQFISSVFIFIAALASRLYFQVSLDFVLARVCRKDDGDIYIIKLKG